MQKLMENGGVIIFRKQNIVNTILTKTQLEVFLTTQVIFQELIIKLTTIHFIISMENS